MSLRRKAVVVALVFAASAHAALSAQLAAVVMLKVLTYDAGFEKRVSGDFVLVVPFDKELPEQAQAFKELEPIGATLLAGHAVKLRPIALDSAASLGELNASAVLLLPGTPSALVEQWSAAAAQRQLYTLSLSPADANQKVMLSVDSAEGKPVLVLNHKLATGAGAVFPPSVLKVARVIR